MNFDKLIFTIWFLTDALIYHSCVTGEFVATQEGGAPLVKTLTFGPTTVRHSVYRNRSSRRTPTHTRWGGRTRLVERTQKRSMGQLVVRWTEMVWCYSMCGSLGCAHKPSWAVTVATAKIPVSTPRPAQTVGSARLGVGGVRFFVRKHEPNIRNVTFLFFFSVCCAWHRLLTNDGDLESNPGPTVASSMVDGFFCVLLGLAVCWLKSLLMDGDVESNPGPPPVPEAEMQEITLFPAEMCVVCQIDFNEDDDVAFGFCGHLLHLNCLRALLTAATDARPPTCPICRSDFSGLAEFVVLQEDAWVRDHSTDGVPPHPGPICVAIARVVFYTLLSALGFSVDVWVHSLSDDGDVQQNPGPPKRKGKWVVAGAKLDAKIAASQAEEASCFRQSTIRLHEEIEAEDFYMISLRQPKPIRLFGQPVRKPASSASAALVPSAPIEMGKSAKGRAPRSTQKVTVVAKTPPVALPAAPVVVAALSPSVQPPCEASVLCVAKASLARPLVVFTGTYPHSPDVVAIAPVGAVVPVVQHSCHFCGFQVPTCVVRKSLRMAVFGPMNKGEALAGLPRSRIVPAVVHSCGVGRLGCLVEGCVRNDYHQSSLLFCNLQAPVVVSKPADVPVERPILCSRMPMPPDVKSSKLVPVETLNAKMRGCGIVPLYTQANDVITVKQSKVGLDCAIDALSWLTNCGYKKAEDQIFSDCGRRTGLTVMQLRKLAGQAACILIQVPAGESTVRYENFSSDCTTAPANKVVVFLPFNDEGLAEAHFCCGHLKAHAWRKDSKFPVSEAVYMRLLSRVLCEVKTDMVTEISTYSSPSQEVITAPVSTVVESLCPRAVVEPPTATAIVAAEPITAMVSGKSLHERGSPANREVRDIKDGSVLTDVHCQQAVQSFGFLQPLTFGTGEFQRTDISMTVCVRGPLPPPFGIFWRRVNHSSQVFWSDLIAEKESRGEICRCLCYPFCKHTACGLFVVGEPTVFESMAWRGRSTVVEIRPSGTNIFNVYQRHFSLGPEEYPCEMDVPFSTDVSNMSVVSVERGPWVVSELPPLDYRASASFLLRRIVAKRNFSFMAVARTGFLVYNTYHMVTRGVSMGAAAATVFPYLLRRSVFLLTPLSAPHAEHRCMTPLENFEYMWALRAKWRKEYREQHSWGIRKFYGGTKALLTTWKDEAWESAERVCKQIKSYARTTMLWVPAVKLAKKVIAPSYRTQVEYMWARANRDSFLPEFDVAQRQKVAYRFVQQCVLEVRHYYRQQRYSARKFIERCYPSGFCWQLRAAAEPFVLGALCCSDFLTAAAKMYLKQRLSIGVVTVGFHVARGLLYIAGTQLREMQRRRVTLEDVVVKGVKNSDLLQIARKVALMDITDPIATRTLLNQVSVKNGYVDAYTRNSAACLVRAMVRHENFIDYSDIVAHMPVREGSASSFGGSPFDLMPFSGAEKPCLFCSRPFTKTNRMKNRLCIHHATMIYSKISPVWETQGARLATMGLPSTDGKHLGPVIFVAKDYPLPRLSLHDLLDVFPKHEDTESILAVLNDKSKTVCPKMAVVLGYGLSCAPCQIAAKGPAVAMKAILCRVARQTESNPRLYAWRLARDIAQFFLIDHLGDSKLQPLPFDEWVSGVRRKTDMIYAKWVLDHHGLPEKLFWKGFVKTEKSLGVEHVDGTFDDLRPITTFKPRLIQAPPDVVHAALGPYTKQILHFVESVWTWRSNTFYAGGATPEEMRLWLQRLVEAHDCWYLLGDFAMMDCTHSLTSFSFIEEFYRAIMDMPPEIIKLLERIRTPKGFCHGEKYCAPHPMNGSGRPDTSLLNIIGNMLSQIAHAASAVSGIAVRDLTLSDVVEAMEHCFIGAAGDDSVVVIPKRVCWRGVWRWTDLSHVEESIGAFGYRVPPEKQFVTDDFRRVVFLGQMPYPVRVDGVLKWFWGPTLGRRLYKHHVMLRPKGDVRAWLHGVAQMEATCYKHVPILYDMACNILQQMKGQKINVYEDPEEQFKVRFNDGSCPVYTQETVTHVEWYYSLVHGSVARAIAELGPVPQMLNDPLYARLLSVDEA